eukprot:526568_1
MSDTKLTILNEDAISETTSLLTGIQISKTASNMTNSSRHPPPTIKQKQEKKQSIDLKLADEIRGALIFNIPKICCCKEYTVRIYLHYWIWQVPVLITNIVLFCIWNTTHSNPNPTIALKEVGFLAVGPVFLCSIVRDKIFLWLIYSIVKNACFCGCTQYARYHVSRLADCIGGLHSSLGVTAFVWNIIYSIGAFVREDNIFNVRTITAFCLPFFLLIICI